MVTDDADPGTEECVHEDIYHIFQGGCPIHTKLWSGDMGGDPPHRPENEGIPQ